MSEIALVVSDGRNPNRDRLRIGEPFAPGMEEEIFSALNKLHLHGVIHYPDGSTREFYPDLPSRVLERVYPPASGGIEDKQKSCPS